MTTFKPKVVDASGSDALLDSTDNLEITAAPTADNHAANKLFVDTEVAAEATARSNADGVLQDAIDAEAQTRADEDAALQEQINLITGDDPGSDNPYVKRAGDDMSGNLTFNTDVIILDATNGTATFTGNVTAGSSTTSYGLSGQNSTDGGNIWQAAVTGRNYTSGGPVFAGLASDFAATSLGVTSVIYENGYVNFRGPLDIFREHDGRDGHAQKWGYFASTTTGSERASVMLTAKGEYYATNNGEVGSSNYLTNISSSGTFQFGNGTDHIKYTENDGLYRTDSGSTVWNLRANGTAYFSGLVEASITGNAATADNATNAGSSTYADNANFTYVEFDETTNNGFYVPFISNWSQDFKRLKIDGTYYYNPSENRLYVSNITGTLSGNATTATDANDSQYLRGMYPTGDAVANTVVSRDGSGHINANYFQGTWLKATHGGDDVNSVSYFPGVSTDGWYYHLNQGNMRTALNVPTTTGGSASGTWGINITGQANNATKLTTARSIALSGDCSGSAAFDGTNNISISTTVVNDSHTHDGRYYTESEADGRFMARYTNNWITTDDGYHRFYFSSAGSTHIKGPNTMYFRPNYTDSNTIYMDSGSVGAASFNSTSDIRRKTDVLTIDNAIDKVNQLNGVEFSWKDTGKRSAGVIAQDVEKVLPQLVIEAPTDGPEEEPYKTVNYNGLIGLLVEAVKDQQKQIDELKKKLELN